jgi:thiol-disulfide isomerase/thioredoxin
MKKIFLGSVLAVVFILSIGWSTFAADKPPQKGETLPSIQLPVPKSLVEKSYLGLSREGSFTIPQIKARVVIIEIFSMYCPYCQKDAPGVNELYQLIEKDPDLKKDIKLIGIGAGNTSYEVGVYKKTYTVPFPLFSDQISRFIRPAGGENTLFYRHQNE